MLSAVVAKFAMAAATVAIIVATLAKDSLSDNEIDVKNQRTDANIFY